MNIWRFIVAIVLAVIANPTIAEKRDRLPPADVAAYNRALAQNAQTTQGMADCLVKGRLAQAREAVANNYSLKQMREKTPGLMRHGCMGGDVPGMGLLRGVVYAGDLYIYALAEAVMRNDKTLDRSLEFSKAPPLDHREPFVDETKFKGSDAPRLIEREKEREAMQSFLSRYGECVTRNSTAETAALLRSSVGSPEERAAFAALQPVLGACLKGQDQLKFGKMALRGALALNYYRLAARSGLTSVATKGS